MLSRVSSALPNLGDGLEFDVVTAVVLGGISVNGGEGKLQGVVIGLLIIAVLSNGMILLGVGTYFQAVIKGLVLLIAVGIDNLSKQSWEKIRESTSEISSKVSSALTIEIV